MKEILEKYSDGVIKNFDKENFTKIINFLQKEKCDFIEDLVEDYFDLFTIDYDEFVSKYHSLNKKYDNQFLSRASSDMNLLEEFYI